MSEDPEKLINISLCKMAESRTIRRGGTSLHKHLLISTVLTKARSAYFETWYMGEGEAADERNGRIVDLNSSYQELDFPLDDEDSDGDEEFSEMNESSSSSSRANNGEAASSSSIEVDSPSAINTHNNAHSGSRVRKGVSENESEIELPSDILNCVEKMVDISDMSFSVDSASTCSTSSVVVQPMTHLETEDEEGDSLTSPTELTYLDLDSSKCTEELPSVASPECSPSGGDNDRRTFGSPNCTSTPHSSKRRRTWNDDDEGDDEDDEIIHSGGGQSFRFAGKLGFSRGIASVAKRLKFSPERNQEEEDNGTKPSYDKNRCSDKNLQFRTKKAHYEEDEQEQTDDDPFLGEALNQSQYDSLDSPQDPKRKNDQRVPSTSSGSSSDEDGDESMEVDQITNLVQFISFNKQTPGPVHLPSSSSPTPREKEEDCNKNMVQSHPSSTNLVRSVSSPDLCGLEYQASKSVSSSSKLLSVCTNSSYLHLCI